MVGQAHGSGPEVRQSIMEDGKSVAEGAAQLRAARKQREGEEGQQGRRTPPVPSPPAAPARLQSPPSEATRTRVDYAGPGSPSPVTSPLNIPAPTRELRGTPRVPTVTIPCLGKRT